MKLSQLEFNPIHCVVYLRDGRPVKTYEQERFDEVIEKVGADKCVIVFNPNEELKKEILTVLDLDVEGNKVTMDGIKTLSLIERLTNLELGIQTGELTLDEALDIVNNPSPMLEMIGQVVNSIFMSILRNQIEVMNEISQIPESVRKPLLEEIVNKAKKEEEKEKQAETEELLRQQKELEEKVKALRGE